MRSKEAPTTAVAGAGVVDQLSSKVALRNSRSPDRPQARVAVSDGRDALGTIDQIDGVFVATDISGEVNGKFGTLKMAAASFGRGAR
jgi:hypothetical protein